MTYLIRSLKYFVTMSVFAIILIVLMILTGFATVNLYEPGSAWRFVVLFGAIAVISLFHPKMTRTVRYVAGNLSNEGKPIVLNAFREADYELVSEKEGVLTFRARTFSCGCGDSSMMASRLRRRETVSASKDNASAFSACFTIGTLTPPMKNKFCKYLLAATGTIAIAAATIFADRNDFGLGRNMELLVNMMRELSVGYVDPVDPDVLMAGAAEGMVRDLDPYTEFIPESEMSDFEVLTTGKYGGIGSLIRQKEDYVRIAQPYENSPADRAGLKIGDRILAIDGKSAAGLTTEEVSKRLKGEPGSKVKVSVRHLDDTEETATIRRERIAIPGVPYAGWLNDSIGYIRHSDFTEGCYEEMQAAIAKLRSEGELKGLVLDYRSNGGGIMQEAVKILGLFVPKGTGVVSTKGRTEDSKNSSRPSRNPFCPTCRWQC